MGKHLNPNENFSMEQAMAFAATPAGRHLLSLLQEKGGSDLQKAQAMAASGNMEDARKALSSLLTDPQIQNLLKQFGG